MHLDLVALGQRRRDKDDNFACSVNYLEHMGAE